MKKVFVLNVVLAMFGRRAAAAAALVSQPHTTRRAASNAKLTSYAPHLREKIASSVAKGERRANDRLARPRQVCNRCTRPPTLCVCDSLPSSLIPTNTHVLVLQHPNEFRKKNFSTVPLLKLVLENMRVKVGYTFDVDELDIEEGRTPLLLFPGPDALELDTADQPAGREAETVSNVAGGTDSNTLILIDGTWAEAKRMMRDSPSLLERCQKVKFASSDSPSVYHAVRREPEAHCLSTLEACAKALDILEDGPVDDNPASEWLRTVLGKHVDSHLTNAITAAPRHNQNGAAGYEKDTRRREIERGIFNDDAEVGGDGSRSPPAMSNDAAEHFAPIQLDSGAMLRPLRPSDAPLVDSWWNYRSATSLSMVACCINADGGVACLGVEGEDGELRACIVRYVGGAVGMLHVEENYRRRGYGAALLRQATRALEERSEECVAFILDGNDASEALFTKAGWERDDPTLKKGTGKRRANRKWIKR